MKSIFKYAVIAAALLLSFGGVANADQIFSTPSGAVDAAGEPVSAMADFSQSGNTLTLTLTNTLLSSIKSAGQLLTGITFTLSDGSGVTLNSQTGDLIQIASNGSVTNLGTLALGWGFGSPGGSSFEVCTICTGGVSGAPTTPSEGIVNAGPYTSANSSIDGNGPHNPYINQTATFTFTTPTGETVSDVSFQFGTTPGGQVATPEASTLLLLGVGVIGLAIAANKRS